MRHILYLPPSAYPTRARLSVTSTLLAMVDPHLPLAATATSGAAPNGRHAPGAPAHPTPLAAVAGDARASVARAASAAAAKVTELKEKMNNTFSGMSLFSKGLLAKKRANSGAGALPPLPPPQDAAGAAAPAAATPAGEEAHGAGGGLTVQRQPSGSHTPVAGQESGVVVGSASSTQAGEGVQQQPHQQQQQQGAVHPGQAFRQHLDLAVQKTYGQVRDSLKRSVSAVLQDCMQVQGQLQGGPGSPLSPRVELHGGEGREGAAEEEGRSAEEEAGEEKDRWRATARAGSLCTGSASTCTVVPPSEPACLTAVMQLLSLQYHGFMAQLARLQRVPDTWSVDNI